MVRLRGFLVAVALFSVPAAAFATALLAAGASAFETAMFTVAPLIVLSLSGIGDTVTAWAIRQSARLGFALDRVNTRSRSIRAPLTGSPERTSFA